MSMNETQVKGKWKEIKGEIQKAWGNLTDDDLERTKGDATAIQGLIQQKYGKMKEDYSQRVSAIFEKFGNHREDKASEIKKSLK